MSDADRPAPYASRPVEAWLELLDDEGLLSVAPAPPDADPREPLLLAEELGFIDASLGWLFATHSAARSLLELLPAAGLEDLHTYGRPFLTAAGAAEARGRTTMGGWTVEGEWTLVSGAPVATHHLVRFDTEDQGPMVGLVEGSELSVVEGSWRSTGLASTMSVSIRARDCFMGRDRVASLGPDAPAPPVPLGLVLLGATRRAFAEADVVAATSRSTTATDVSARSMRIGVGLAAWQAVRHWRLHLSESIARGEVGPPQAALESRLCEAHLHRVCVQAVRALRQDAGTAALDPASPLATIEADLVAAGAHPDFRPGRILDAGEGLQVPP